MIQALYAHMNNKKKKKKEMAVIYQSRSQEDLVKILHKTM
jgi:hypothetical protein